MAHAAFKDLLRRARGERFITMGELFERPGRCLASVAVAVALVTTTTGVTDHEPGKSGGRSQATVHRNDGAKSQPAAKGHPKAKDHPHGKDHPKARPPHRDPAEAQGAGSARPANPPTMGSPGDGSSSEHSTTSSGAPAGASANARRVICHATGNNKRPYHRIQVSVNGVLGGHAKSGPLWTVTAKSDGTGWGDIIPPFPYNDHGSPAFYPGLNWSAAGRATFAAGCVVARPAVLGPPTKTGGEPPPAPFTGGEAVVHRHGGTLAFTGAPLDVLAKLAPLNLLLGLLLLVAGRRRRSTV